MCFFFLWIIKSDVWVTEKSELPGGMKTVEIYVCVVLLWYLKDQDEREPSQMFLFWFQTLMEKPPLQLCSIWISPPIPSNFHPHTPLLDSAEAVAGMLLTMAGITLCVISSVDDAGPGDVTHWQIIRTKDSNPCKWFLGRSRNRPKHSWSRTKEGNLDSVGSSLRATGPGGRIMPTGCDAEKKAGPETCKRQVEKEAGWGGVHVKATRDLWPS